MYIMIIGEHSTIPTHIVYTHHATWRSYRDLTLGKVYKVKEFNEFSKRFRIKDDVGDNIHVSPYHFALLEDIRDQKINTIFSLE